MKKPSLIIIILFGLIITLSIVKVMAYNRLSTSGVFVGKVEEEITSYKRQNAILTQELLNNSSLTNISVKAEKIGFVKEDSLMILKTSPLAVKQ